MPPGNGIAAPSPTPALPPRAPTGGPAPPAPSPTASRCTPLRSWGCTPLCPRVLESQAWSWPRRAAVRAACLRMPSRWPPGACPTRWCLPPPVPIPTPSWWGAEPTWACPPTSCERSLGAFRNVRVHMCHGVGSCPVALLLNTDAQAVLICACTPALASSCFLTRLCLAKRILHPLLQPLPQVGAGGGE